MPEIVISADTTDIFKRRLDKFWQHQHILYTSDKSLSHTDRLQKFGLTTLETRRLRGDLIEVFKMFKGFDNIMLNDFFKLSQSFGVVSWVELS